MIHESSLARSCADVGGSCAAGVVPVSAAPCVAALPADRALTYARVAANARGEVASACNSGSLDTVNLLRVQHSTSYNLQGVVAPNSRRKVRRICTVGNRSAERTVDMSPAPAAGTYRRSASTRKRLARSSGVGAGPGPGPGGRSGLVGGVPGLAAACLEIPCSVVVPPGRHQIAPQSLGWARVCGTENSGVRVLKGDARTYNLPGNLPDVTCAALAPLTDYVAPGPVIGHIAPARAALCSRDFSEASTPMVVGSLLRRDLLHPFSVSSTRNRSLQGRRHRTS